MISTDNYRVEEDAGNVTVVITRQGDTSVAITLLLSSQPIDATGKVIPFSFHSQWSGNAKPSFKVHLLTLCLALFLPDLKTLLSYSYFVDHLVLYMCFRDSTSPCVHISTNTNPLS